MLKRCSQSGVAARRGAARLRMRSPGHEVPAPVRTGPAGVRTPKLRVEQPGLEEVLGWRAATAAALLHRVATTPAVHCSGPRTDDAVVAELRAWPAKVKLPVTAARPFAWLDRVDLGDDVPQWPGLSTPRRAASWLDFSLTLSPSAGVGGGRLSGGPRVLPGLRQ